MKHFTKQTLVRELRPRVALHRHPTTGIAVVVDGNTGTGHSCHPNIDRTGSVQGMRDRGYWSAGERTAFSFGFIYNIDRLVVTPGDDLDQIAQAECQCPACVARRKNQPDMPSALPVQGRVTLDFKTWWHTHGRPAVEAFCRNNGYPAPAPNTPAYETAEQSAWLAYNARGEMEK